MPWVENERLTSVKEYGVTDPWVSPYNVECPAGSDTSRRISPFYLACNFLKYLLDLTADLLKIPFYLEIDYS